MSPRPLAYHITFGTYGTRLHGDPRGTVSRSENRFGDPIIGADRHWGRVERKLLNRPPVILSIDQRVAVERAMPSICQRGGWLLHACAGRGDHVHTLLTTDRDADAVRRWLKTWVGQALSARWQLPAGATWWAEGGSIKWVFDPRYFEQVHWYVTSQSTLGRWRDRPDSQSPAPSPA